MAKENKKELYGISPVIEWIRREKLKNAIMKTYLKYISNFSKKKEAL